jgi:hypothetical protein
MLTFCGTELRLTVDQVLLRQDGPLLCTGRDAAGMAWLILRVDNSPSHLGWLCAPQTERALQAVTANPQAAYDAIRHSATGTAEAVTIHNGQPLPDQCLLGAHIPDHNPIALHSGYLHAA